MPARRRPWVQLPWDGLSDQPARLRDRFLRQTLRADAWGGWIATTAAVAVGWPLAVAQAAIGPWPKLTQPMRIGVGVSPLDHDPLRIRDLLDELGCGLVLARFEWRRMHRWPELLAGLRQIGRPVLAVLVQDRAAVCDHRRWQAGLLRFYSGISDEIEAVQALQAVNRLKWGCATVGESLPLLAEAGRWHRHFAGRRPLLGASVIDFEPLGLTRALIHGHRLRCAGTAAALYVDRRGGPAGRQYGCFDLTAKIRATAALTAISPHSGDRLWITEFNWPLRGHGAHAPTSHAECVDEDTAARHTAAYLAQASATGLVERVYHWQLLATGYGLVDPRDYRKRPAFSAIQRILKTP